MRPGGDAERAVADHVRMNRRSWNETSDGYQEEHGPQISGRLEPGWGVWQIPERELRILGDVADREAGVVRLRAVPSSAAWAT